MKKIINFIKSHKKIVIICLIVVILLMVASIIFMNGDNTIVSYKEYKEELPNGIIREDGVLVFNLKEEDFLNELKKQYINLWESDYKISFDKSSDGWNTVELKTSQEYIGENYYDLTATAKLFRVLSVHNGYIKEIEMSYIPTDDGGVSDTTYILAQVFIQLTGFSFNDEDMKYIESTTNVLSDASKAYNHWRYSEFNMAVKYARPGDYIYGLPTDISYNKEGTTTKYLVKTDNDTKPCNNIKSNLTDDSGNMTNTTNNNSNDNSDNVNEITDNNSNYTESSTEFENTSTNNSQSSSGNSSSSDNKQNDNSNNNDYNDYSNNGNNNQPQEKNIQMPNVIGMSTSQAEQKLNELGIAYNISSITSLSKDNVFYQSVSAGTSKPKSQFGTVTLKAYRKVTQVSANITISSSNYNGKTIKVLINGKECKDMMGNTTFNGKYSVMTYVNNPNVSIEVYIDNSLVKSQSINLDQISEKNGTSSNEISATINI